MAAFGNVHGVYKLKCELTPVILKNSQEFVEEKQVDCPESPLILFSMVVPVLSREQIREAIDMVCENESRY